jgi:hypothetical protein
MIPLEEYPDSNASGEEFSERERVAYGILEVIHLVKSISH